MARTPFTRSLHLLAAVALFSGISLTALQGPLFASLAGGDVMLINEVIPGAQLRQAPPAAADPLAQAEAAAQLVLGLMLIVLGFFLHGFARVREERPVHITVAPKKKPRTWFWVEMRV